MKTTINKRLGTTEDVYRRLFICNAKARNLGSMCIASHSPPAPKTVAHYAWVYLVRSWRQATNGFARKVFIRFNSYSKIWGINSMTIQCCKITKFLNQRNDLRTFGFFWAHPHPLGVLSKFVYFGITFVHYFLRSTMSSKGGNNMLQRRSVQIRHEWCHVKPLAALQPRMYTHTTFSCRWYLLRSRIIWKGAL
jgi:hypothetical protein